MVNQEEQSKKISGLENTDEALLLVIPAKAADLSDDDLDRVVGGESIDSGEEGG